MKSSIIPGTRKHSDFILSMPFKTVIRKGITLRIAYTGVNTGVCVVRNNNVRTGIELPHVDRFLRSLL
jgi:hypothetical protein